ncbi:MAG: ankyrin repeat domain-containing protein [Myxococcales bacterium]
MEVLNAMKEQEQLIEQLYEQAKRGDWDEVLEAWRTAGLVRECGKHQKESSGWTFLHQAAYWGHELACRELIRAGAPAGALSRERQTPADVAMDRQHATLALLLRRASQSGESVWKAPKDAALLPSSSLWEDAQQRQALELRRVAYAGGVVTIPAGARYYVDSFERTLVGWHGTYDPPCGMDGESMV